MDRLAETLEVIRSLWSGDTVDFSGRFGFLVGEGLLHSLDQIESVSSRGPRFGTDAVQNSVQVDLSGIEKSEKTIDHDGKPLKLHIVRPAGAGEWPAGVGD